MKRHVSKMPQRSDQLELRRIQLPTYDHSSRGYRVKHERIWKKGCQEEENSTIIYFQVKLFKICRRSQRRTHTPRQNQRGNQRSDHSLFGKEQTGTKEQPGIEPGKR